jgi:hypothetical protein
MKKYLKIRNQEKRKRKKKISNKINFLNIFVLEKFISKKRKILFKRNELIKKKLKIVF